LRFERGIVWPEQIFTAENMNWDDGAKTITLLSFTFRS